VAHIESVWKAFSWIEESTLLKCVLFLVMHCIVSGVYMRRKTKMTQIHYQYIYQCFIDNTCTLSPYWCMWLRAFRSCRMCHMKTEIIGSTLHSLYLMRWFQTNHNFVIVCSIQGHSDKNGVAPIILPMLPMMQYLRNEMGQANSKYKCVLVTLMDNESPHNLLANDTIIIKVDSDAVSYVE
jgi:hypothetical protein